MIEESPLQLNALLSLLDDPEPFVQNSIRARLVEIGDRAVPSLKRMIRESDVAFAVQNAQAVLRQISLQRFQQEIDRIASAQPPEDDIDLEQGVFAVALLGYPDLRVDDYLQQLDTMASRLEYRLRGALSGLLAVKEFNRYLVEELGFHGCRQENYYEPDNSYINRVLDRRVGIPISLSAIYLLIARRLGVPLYGIGFPAHFLLKYQSATQEFYVDAFNGGMILSQNDCRRTLRATGVEFNSQYFEPVSNRVIVMRMMRNLAEIYRAEDPELAVELDGAISEISPSSPSFD